LILDEASEGLAPLIAREIWRIIGTIRETGIAAIIVDKNFAAVSAITDRNVILVKGRVVFAGTSIELRQKLELLLQHRGFRPKQRRRRVTFIVGHNRPFEADRKSVLCSKILRFHARF